MMKKAGHFLKTHKSLWISFAICLSALGFNLLAPKIPGFIERVYIPYLFKPFNSLWSRLTGLLPFSLAEIALIVLLPATLLLLLFAAVLSIVRRSGKPILRFLRAFATTAFLLLAFFTLTYSVTYNRAPLAAALGYDIRAHSVDDLARLCETLTAKTNEAAAGALAGQNGVMVLSRPQSWYYRASLRGYEALSERIPALSGRFGPPKPVLLSTPMCYTGIVGIYFPFTGEANLNTRTPLPDLLYAMTHEMAHQRGYAREDEANFIGYLACVNSPDPEFVYAGYYEALLYATNALYGYDQDAYWRVRAQWSPRVEADMAASSAFWKQFEGPVEKISTAVNDTYLKTQQIYDGVYSYGRVVDLLLAEADREGT